MKDPFQNHSIIQLFPKTFGRVEGAANIKTPEQIHKFMSARALKNADKYKDEARLLRAEREEFDEARSLKESLSKQPKDNEATMQAAKQGDEEAAKQGDEEIAKLGDELFLSRPYNRRSSMDKMKFYRHFLFGDCEPPMVPSELVQETSNVTKVSTSATHLNRVKNSTEKDQVHSSHEEEAAGPVTETMGRSASTLFTVHEETESPSSLPGEDPFDFSENGLDPYQKFASAIKNLHESRPAQFPKAKDVTGSHISTMADTNTHSGSEKAIKLDRVDKMEQQIVNQGRLIKDLKNRVANLETRVAEKDDLITNLTMCFTSLQLNVAKLMSKVNTSHEGFSNPYDSDNLSEQCHKSENPCDYPSTSGNKNLMSKNSTSVEGCSNTSDSEDLSEQSPDNDLPGPVADVSEVNSKKKPPRHPRSSKKKKPPGRPRKHPDCSSVLDPQRKIRHLTRTERKPLYMMYEHTKVPNLKDLRELENVLQIDRKLIDTWFLRRRAKDKKRSLFPAADPDEQKIARLSLAKRALLYDSFAKNAKPDLKELQRLADELCFNKSVITRWFTNARRPKRKQSKC